MVDTPGLESSLLRRVFLQWPCSVFGIGSIIYVGIEMGGLFTLGLGGSSLVTCGELASVLRPSLQLLFIFLQMHFLFLTRHQAALFRGSRWAKPKRFHNHGDGPN